MISSSDQIYYNIELCYYTVLLYSLITILITYVTCLLYKFPRVKLRKLIRKFNIDLRAIPHQKFKIFGYMLIV